MTEEILEKARLWITDQFDPETRAEVQELIDEEEEKELEDRFYKDLEFGTGGMRGIMAAGTNRMNVYTVGRATQGLCNYVLDHYPDAPARGICIAYDSRNNSRKFAQEAALVIAANGINVFLFKELRPTPLLSFAVMHLGCAGGIVITASHNPKEYNGYKVYSSYGHQVVPPEDLMIVQSVGRVDIAGEVKRIAFSDGLSKGLIKEIDGEVEAAYLERVNGFVQRLKKGIGEELSKLERQIKVVYTPIHGTGITLVPPAIEMAGGATLLIEPGQAEPDGDFPTVASPNPEEKEALGRAIAFAEKEDADLVIGTDPDCDRLGCAVSDGSGGFQMLSGNQVGVLFAHLMGTSYKKSGLMPSKPVIISTIVSTEMIKPVARDFGIEVIDVLTGFKYFGEKMYEFEEKKEKSFIYGFEESYGYLADTFVRDKDGVIAAVLALLLVQYAIGRYGSVPGYLQSLYEKYGVYAEYQRSFSLKGIEGASRIQAIMTSLRENPPLKIADEAVTVIKDYKRRVSTNVRTGDTQEITDIPESNVLQLYTENEVKVSIRPSGTEPKIKFYFGLNLPLTESESSTRAMLEDLYRKVSEHLFARCGLE